MGQITLKDAVARAKSHLFDLYADDSPDQLALEEIEHVDEGGKSQWAVTFGFKRKRDISVVPPNNNSILDLMRTQPKEIEHRVYKTILIDAGTGDFIKMDMRRVS